MNRQLLFSTIFALSLVVMAVSCGGTGSTQIEDSEPTITSNKVTPMPDDNVQLVSSIMVQYSIDDLITKSSIIALGKVVEIEPFYWGYAQGKQVIYANVIIQPERSILGQDIGSIVIRTQGGRIGTTVMVVENEPEFKLDERVLVFLQPVESNSSQDFDKMFKVTGALQGKWDRHEDRVVGITSESTIQEIENQIAVLQLTK